MYIHRRFQTVWKVQVWESYPCQEMCSFSSLIFCPHCTSHAIKPPVTGVLLSYSAAALVNPRIFISFISCDWNLWRIRADDIFYTPQVSAHAYWLANKRQNMRTCATPRPRVICKAASGLIGAEQSVINVELVQQQEKTSFQSGPGDACLNEGGEGLGGAWMYG